MQSRLLLLFVSTFALLFSAQAQVEEPEHASVVAICEKLDSDCPVSIQVTEDGLFYIPDNEGGRNMTFLYQLTIDIKNEEMAMCAELVWVFMDGKKESLWKKIGPERQEATYHNGLLHGVHRLGHRRVFYFENGTGNFVTYYNDNWQVFVQGEMINGKRVGTWETFFRSGQIRCIENYKDGMLEGKRTTYFESGQIRFEEHYKNNLLHGKYTAYDEEGNVLYTTVFTNGSGRYKLYDVETKNIKEDGRFRNGYRVGDWVETSYYTPDGEKQERRVRRVKKYTKESPENRHLTHKLIDTVYDDGNIYHVYASNPE